MEYRCYLELGEVASGDGGRMIPVAGFSLTEQYNAGWRGNVLLVSNTVTPLSIGNMMGAAMTSGIIPGSTATLRLALLTDDETDGTLVRSWPVIIGEVEPFQTAELTTKVCQVSLLDPISFLGDRTIWGCYRACSAAEMVGGALSIAAGGDGKPALQPLLPGLPQLNIRSAFREALEEVPYSIAVGQNLGEWLLQVLGLLGLRMELLGKSDGSLDVLLTDAAPTGTPMPMSDLPADAAEGDTPAPTRGRLHIDGLSARPGGGLRGAILDDPSLGGFRRIGGGAVGNLFSGVEIGVDEAAYRSTAEVISSYTEMLVVSTLSRQPGFRPGRLVELDRTLRGKDTWQLARVTHRLQGRVYANRATLLVGDASWHPDLPKPRPPVIVPAIVDGGTDFEFHEPVPRDRLGRIPVQFPFIPSPMGDEAAMLAAADADRDGRITLDDFGLSGEGSAGGSTQYAQHGGTAVTPTAALASFSTSGGTEKERAEEQLAAFRNGEFEDPFPGRSDDELSSEELAERRELAAKRQAALRYLGYKRALALDSADRDRDGYVTDRDALVSDALKASLEDPESRATLEDQWRSYQAGELEDDYPDVSQAAYELLMEYGRLFGDDALTGEDAELIEKARRDALLEPERWPPRLPLTIVQPMAGGLHGFIPAHRQGAACRVAVHDPLWAEAIGFQYRDDRPLNAGISGATAGIVVEHDTNEAWSGMVFRRTDDEHEQASGN